MWYTVVENSRLGYDSNRSVNKHRATHVVYRSSTLTSKSSCAALFFHFFTLPFWQKNYSAVNASVSLIPNPSYTVVMVSSDHVYLQALKDSLVKYDEVFDFVYPPVEWEEDGKTWRRIASTKPVTREDVIDFKREFRSQLKYWQVREQGLCRARRELYAQCFGE